MKTFIITFYALVSCTMAFSTEDPRLLKALRQDKAGWIYVHLEGSPKQIGFQHGYLLANEIDTTIQAVSYWLKHETPYNWQFYRMASARFRARSTARAASGIWLPALGCTTSIFIPLR